MFGKLMVLTRRGCFYHQLSYLKIISQNTFSNIQRYEIASKVKEALLRIILKYGFQISAVVDPSRGFLGTSKFIYIVALQLEGWYHFLLGILDPPL